MLGCIKKPTNLNASLRNSEINQDNRTFKFKKLEEETVIGRPKTQALLTFCIVLNNFVNIHCFHIINVLREHSTMISAKFKC